MDEAVIIPYQELLGNYDITLMQCVMRWIIPYQELLGNYDKQIFDRHKNHIIPYQELLGNYDLAPGAWF